MNSEKNRLEEDSKREKNWKRWGPYLSERQWGTVREDYSEDGACWNYFPHDHARSRAYRWGEDGLLGITDRECRLCFSIALWNGVDPILKERLFGLNNEEGNHGEDVKECYYYLDSAPTHSYMKALYKYPQNEFPYSRIVKENSHGDRTKPEFEIADTGVFDEKGYFDVTAEYAKSSPDDILIRITIQNHGNSNATISVLPTLWFRNTWVWGCKHEGCTLKPRIWLENGEVLTKHNTLGEFKLIVDEKPEWLFTENETNMRRLYGSGSYTPYVKDAFHDYIVHKKKEAVNPKMVGTKAAAHYNITLKPGEKRVIKLRLSTGNEPIDFSDFDKIFTERINEADEFYDGLLAAVGAKDEYQIARQAYAGLLWSKQFYHFVVNDWLEGDSSMPKPPEKRKLGRNAEWSGHLFNRDIISMPDKWEYPWYAAWDLAFHMIPFAQIDMQFAKDQLILFLREWFMHPNGQLPAYEFSFGDVNPPVHAWACWRVYKMTGEKENRDKLFLARAFQKLILNFTWWVNRKDKDGKNIFGGGFLGLDNIGVFDRSKPLPTGGHLEQADGTAWMAFFCGTMLSMALELAKSDPSYEDMASKFFEHFVAIADAMNSVGGSGLWDEEDGFYYDQISIDDKRIPLKIRSLVGLIPLLAVEVLDDHAIENLHGFKKRTQWFLSNRPDLAACISYMCSLERKGKCYRLLAIPCEGRLRRVLKYMLDENEFLSPYGIRSLSKYHEKNPYAVNFGGTEHRVEYTPGESLTGLFGGNSNWRGPIWFPINYLIIEALEKYHKFYGSSFKVEFPTNSGKLMNLKQVSRELSKRLIGIFAPDKNGVRPCHGKEVRYSADDAWKELILFYEYFHGDTGRGCGSSHQTGWTALVARIIEKNSRTS